MNATLVAEIANAVLYEGYILYPYRASAIKNRQRFNFGVVVPQAYCDEGGAGERSSLHTECLVRADARASLTVRVRFLHAMTRTTAPESMSWQEASERDISLHASLSALATDPVRRHFHFVSQQLVEPPEPGTGCSIVRTQQALAGHLEVGAQPAEPGLFRIRVHIANASSVAGVDHADREQLLMRAFLSTHAILQIEGGEFLSLLDPPDSAGALAAGCSQSGLWPVLVGDEGAIATRCWRRRSSCTTTRRSHPKAPAISSTGPRSTKCSRCGS